MRYVPGILAAVQAVLEDSSVVLLNDAAGPEPRPAFQPSVDIGIGGDEVVAGTPFDELERRDPQGFARRLLRLLLCPRYDWLPGGPPCSVTSALRLA